MLLAATGVASCIDGNDWEVDPSTSRLFQIVSSAGTADATTLEFKWVKTPGAEYCIIELSKDTLYDEIPMRGTATSVVLGEDKSITYSPYIVTGLDSDTKYYIRYKLMSDTQKESLWSYPEQRFFKTKPEQIMYSVGNLDKSSSSATVRWEAGQTVTHLEAFKTGNSSNATRYDLTTADIEAGCYTLSNLEPNTEYTVNLYNNTVRRGYAIFTTFPEAPDADQVLYLTADVVISTDYLNELAAQYPGESITLALPGDSKFSVEEKLVIPDGMSINVFGLPGEGKTVLSIQGNLDIAGTHEYITFQNLDLDGTKADGKPAGYVINQSDPGSVNNITFDDCVVRNFATSFFRMQKGSGMKTVGHLTLNNCIFSNIGAGYYFIHIDADSGKLGVLNGLTISKCTFNTISATGKGFIYSNKTNMAGDLLISDCTFYKVGGGSNYFIDFSASANPASITIKNCLMGSTGDETMKGIRTKDVSPQVDNTYATSEWAQTGNVVEYRSYSGSTADLFANPAEGDFTLIDASVQVGDPRWIEQ